MSTDKINEFDNASKGIDKDVIKMMASFLAAFHEAKGPLKMDPAMPTPAPVTNLLYDLAALHTKTVRDLATLSAKHTDTMVEYIKERKKPQGASVPSQAVQGLAVVELKHGDVTVVSSPFRIRNKSNKARTYIMPDVLEFVRTGSSNSETVFMNVNFKDTKMEIPPESATGPGVKSSALEVQWDSRLAVGVYRAAVPLEEDGVVKAQFIIDLNVMKVEGAVT